MNLPKKTIIKLIYEERIDELVKYGKLAVPGLIEILRGYKRYNPDNIDWAPEVLRRIGRPAVPALIRALDDEDKRLRFDVKHILDSIFIKEPDDGREGAPELIAMLNDKDPKTRRWAAQGLRYMRDPDATSALIETLKDDDELAGFHAARALEKIGTSPDPHKKSVLTKQIFDFTRSEWFLKEMEKNSPKFERITKVFASILSRIKTMEPKDQILDPKFRRPEKKVKVRKVQCGSLYI